MCTAIAYAGKSFYFGRNLDLHHSYGEGVTVTPRNYPFHFRNGTVLTSHYALIGMAVIADGYPLYYDASNEKGLSMAGLNFPDNAVYYSKKQNKDNVAPFELIPWILGQCATVQEARQLLRRVNVWKLPFSRSYPLSPLHWLLSDKQESVTVETLQDGMCVTVNPIGVLTNNPPFPYHMYHLVNHLNLTAAPPENRFSTKLELNPYSLGMGAMGLPGDLSSASRFVRAAFAKYNAVTPDSEESCVHQFFHMLSFVSQPRGLTAVSNDEFEYTLYSSCCNTDTGVYYYTTYDNSRITCVDLHREALDGSELRFYPLVTDSQILVQNMTSG